MALKVNKLLTPYNFTNGTKGRIKYIVIHYVGALGGAEENCKYYASKYLGASAHYFVGFGGEVWQSVEDENIAWHCGAKSYRHPECRNSNSIGIELCVRNNGSQTADSKDWYFEDATVEAAVGLTKQLMQEYGIPAGHVIRHYDVTGKNCPNPYVFNTTKHTWEAFKAAVAGEAQGGTEAQPAGLTPISGEAQAEEAQMAAYLLAQNPDVPASVLGMLHLYLSEGGAEGIRGDIAFAQSCLETGNFTFAGSAVSLVQNNFCGMGVTGKGLTGNSFASPQLGIRAQVQHLKAYANAEDLKQACIDPRFKYVERGCAPYVEWLGQKENPQGKGWAAGAGYGRKILAILADVLKMEEAAPDADSTRPQASASVPYLVTTTCDALNIRSGPGTGYLINGTIREPEGRKKQYTVVEEKDGWGRLKSGVGWISLARTKRVAAAGNAAFVPYLVSTTCAALNIRSGPGMSYKEVGQIHEPGFKNKYTIVEEKDGWGRLKSGAGWISLSHVKRA